MNLDLAKAFMYFAAMLFSLTVHEAAHALAAKLQGDDTAARLGRLTLNPIPHLDLFGTVILPLLGTLFQMPILGWAKPVPVDPRNLRDPKWGNVIVAFAGPASNLVLCFLCVVVLAIHHLFLQALIPDGSLFYPLVKLVGAMVWVNAILAIFNLLPLPPLDGAAVAHVLLPPKWAEAYEMYVTPYGFFILLALLMTGGLVWVGGLASTYVAFVQTVVGLMFGGFAGG